MMLLANYATGKQLQWTKGRPQLCSVPETAQLVQPNLPRTGPQGQGSVTSRTKFDMENSTYRQVRLSTTFPTICRFPSGAWPESVRFTGVLVGLDALAHQGGEARTSRPHRLDGPL